MDFLMCLYFCEALEQKYSEKEIPEPILMDTLLDIVLWTDTHYELTGTLGFSEVGWIMNHFYFQIFRLGRLQFCMEKCYKDIDTAAKKDDCVIGVHIPRGQALDKDECVKSINAAREFFKKYFPEYEYKCFTCHSWLLDDTLLQFMNENSNIIKFQRLFKIVHRNESIDILRFTISWAITKDNFHEFKPINSFTERVMKHILDGGKFYIAYGYIPK